MSTAWNVLLPQPIEKEAVQILEEHTFNIVIAKEPKPEVVAPLMKDARAIVLRTGIKITKELLDHAEDLWMISRTGAGVDNVDLKAATDKGVIVTSSIGANTTSVAEHCLALMMCLFKQLFLMDREVRNNNFGIRYKNIPRDLRGKTLGIIGFGKIGSLVAESCRSMFNMKILANDDFLSAERKNELSSWVRFTDMETLFKGSDVISVHIPLTVESQGIINRRFLSLMKPDAFLINTSRGGVVNEADLIVALSEGSIGGAGLDVFESEPIQKDNPLLKLPNVILTPHTAALTEECVIRMAVSGAQRVVDLYHGFLPENVANPEVLSLDKWKGLKKRK